MATTINSGYANSPKLTANIADHADVFGGRALVFDGVTDYLDSGSQESTWKNVSALSITTWIYINAHKTSNGLIGKHQSDNESTGIMTTASSFNFYISNGGENRGSCTPPSAGAWHHIACVFNGGGTGNSGRMQIYLNGSLQSLSFTGTIPATTSNNSTYGTNSVTIGDYQGGNKFNGNMADVKIFNTALTEAQVTELYIKPENTPSAVQDNLVAWYPMIEGNPDSPQSIVYDHSEKKLGSDTFGGLNKFQPKVVDREIISVSGDELTLTIPSANDAGMHTGNLANLGLSTSLGYAVGDLVKLQFEAKIVTNGSGYGETVRWYDSNGYVFPATNISLTSEYQTFTFINEITNLSYSIPSFLRMGNRTGTDVYNLKNFSVQKITSNTGVLK